MAATMSGVFPRLPSTSKTSPFKAFPEDVWCKIIDMGNVDMGLLLKRKTKSSVKGVAKTSKKRKPETGSDGKMEVKVKVTIDEEQSTLVADYNERDLIAVVDRDFFSQESETTTMRRTSSRKRETTTKRRTSSRKRRR